MKITVHIGSTKTGSSALQMHLYSARSALEDVGVCYPDMGVKSNAHHVLFASAHPGAWGMHRDVLSAKEDERFQYFVKTFSSILDYAERKNIGHLVLSSEYWWTLLPPRFHELVKLQFIEHDVRLVTCVRRQDRWLEASYLQDVKSGEDKPFDAWLAARIGDQSMGGANYLKILNHWTETLLPVETVVIPYEFEDRTSYIRNVASRVCDSEVGELVVPTVANVVNKSPNKQGLDAIIAVNRDSDPELNRGQKVCEILSSQSRPENSNLATVLDVEQQIALYKKFEHVNRLVVDLHCGRSMDTLFDVADLVARRESVSA